MVSDEFQERPTHLTNSKSELEWFVSVHRRVKLGSGAELASVVHGELVTSLGHLGAAGRDVVNLNIEEVVIALH